MMDRSQGTRSAWTGDARKVQVTRSQELGVHGGQETGSDGTGSASERDAGTRGPECAAGAAGAGAAWAGDSGQASTHRSWCRSPGRCLPCRRHCRHCRCRPPDRPGDGAPRPACRPAPEVQPSRRGPAPDPERKHPCRAAELGRCYRSRGCWALEADRRPPQRRLAIRKAGTGRDASPSSWAHTSVGEPDGTVATRNETTRFQRALEAERGNFKRGMSQSVGTGEVGGPGGPLSGDDFRDQRPGW